MNGERSPRYLAALEAARYLGVSRRTFYEHVRRGVRWVRIGGRVVFDTADLDVWAEAHKTAVEGPPEPPRPASVEPVRTAMAHLKKLREQGREK